MTNIQDFSHLIPYYLDFVYYLLIKSQSFKQKQNYTKLMFAVFQDKRRQDKELTISTLKCISKVIQYSEDYEMEEFILFG